MDAPQNLESVHDEVRYAAYWFSQQPEIHAGQARLHLSEGSVVVLHREGFAVQRGVLSDVDMIVYAPFIEVSRPGETIEKSELVRAGTDRYAQLLAAAQRFNRISLMMRRPDEAAVKLICFVELPEMPGEWTVYIHIFGSRVSPQGEIDFSIPLGH